MDNTKATEIIEVLCNRWQIKEKKFFSEIINFLDKSINKKLSFSNFFEFSFIEGEPKIRFIHLNFWQSNLSINTIKNIVKKREETIIFVFKKIKDKFNCCYNVNLGNKFLKFNRKFGFWPIQFGLEYQKNLKPKIKLYLSVNKSFFPLKSFSDSFGINYKILKKEFKNKKFDTIAIDFLPGGKYIFKFYPITKKNKGILFRLNQDSKIISQKIWQRISKGLTLNKVEKSNFIKLPYFIKNIIIKNKLKIHYLCQENGKKSIYFR